MCTKSQAASPANKSLKIPQTDCHAPLCAPCDELGMHCLCLFFFGDQADAPAASARRSVMPRVYKQEVKMPDDATLTLTGSLPIGNLIIPYICVLLSGYSLYAVTSAASVWSQGIHPRLPRDSQ